MTCPCGNLNLHHISVEWGPGGYWRLTGYAFPVMFCPHCGRRLFPDGTCGPDPEVVQNNLDIEQETSRVLSERLLEHDDESSASGLYAGDLWAEARGEAMERLGIPAALAAKGGGEE